MPRQNRLSKCRDLLHIAVTELESGKPDNAHGVLIDLEHELNMLIVDKFKALPPEEQVRLLNLSARRQK